MKLEVCVERETLLGVQVGLGDVCDDLLATLGHGDVDDRGLAAELGVGDFEEAGALLRAAQEVSVEGDGVGLVLGFQSGGEVKLRDGEEVAAYDAAIGNWERELVCEVLRKEGEIPLPMDQSSGKLPS